MTYQELNNQKRTKVDTILENSGIFFAFNDKQMKREIEKHNITKENKITSIGGGGYLPIKNIETFEKDMETLEKWYKEQEKKIKVEITPVEIDYKKYEYMLCVLPPIYCSNGIFQVSEPHDHIIVDGKEFPRYSTYQELNGKYYSLGILTTPQATAYAKD